ncbi:MAG: hypothetical protein CL661_04060 [Bacteroidetes bacterium]|mgnify:CR=1 FL=1|nr:hypothetical protein [Bacteroidota bacterium]
MKKLIIVLLFIAQISFGQSVNRQFIGLSIGPSFPLDDFSKAVLDDSTSGFAKTGVALVFNYAYRVTHNFGFQLIINYSGNSLDNNKYKSELEAAHPDYGVSVESTKNWSSGGLFVGPYLRFPITEKLSWDVRGLVGFFGSYSPKATIRRIKKDDPNAKLEPYYIESSRASNFGYTFGTGLKYRIGSYYALLFGDYVTSNLKFKDVSGWDWDSEPYTTSFNQKINYFTVTAGVGYIL